MPSCKTSGIDVVIKIKGKYLSLITLRQLEIFTQAVSHGSFRRLADHIGISQVAISEHIRELEERLGAKLFDRHSGGAPTLTPAGEEALVRANDILNDVNDLVWLFSNNKSKDKNIKIGTHPYIMQFMQIGLDEFSQNYPEIKIEFEFDCCSWPEAKPKLDNNNIDIAFYFDVDSKDSDANNLIRTDKLAFYIGNNHPLAQQSNVSLEDLSKVKMLALAHNNFLRKCTDEALKNIGLNNLKLGLETNEYALLLTMAARNQGFVCMFESNAQTLGEESGIKRIDYANRLPEIQIKCATKHSSRHNKMISEMKNMLIDAIIKS